MHNNRWNYFVYLAYNIKKYYIIPTLYIKKIWIFFSGIWTTIEISFILNFIMLSLMN